MWDELLAILDGYDKATHSEVLQWSEDPELNKLLPTMAPASDSAGPSREKTTAVLLVGEQYGSYRVVRELTPGGMGQVFLAEDVRMPRRVVLKSLAGKWLESPAAQQRFRREANTACVLNHGNIATLYDVVEDRGRFLLVFEYVEGRTLRRLFGDGMIPVGLALRLAIQLTDAITYAHDQGIFHCDIKPENIQVTPDNKIKVLDFGLARARYDTGQGVSEGDRGKLMGTAGYMAPERLIRGTLNASGDIYCIGVVVFELLTGRHPYPDRGPSQVLAILGTDAPRLSTLVGGISPDLDMISERALSPDPNLRYQSARELGRDLRRVLDRLDVVVSPKPHEPDLEKVKRDPTFWILAGVAAIPAIVIALTLIGFASVIMFNGPLGRTGEFEPESPIWWPWRGIESLLAPSILAVGLAVFLSLAPLVLRMLSLGPLQTWLAPMRSAFGRGVEALKSQPVPVLAAGLLFIQLVVAAVMTSRFDSVFEGLSSFISTRPPVDLSPLRPENRPELNLFTKSFSYQVVVFGFAWYALIRHRRKRKEKGGTLTITAGLAVTVLTLLFGQVFPRQIIYKNRFERITYQSKRCYLVGQRASDGLLFCPHQEPPWNTIVRLDDPALKREGVVESIFSGFDSGR